MFFTIGSPTFPDVDAITIDRDAGSLGDGIHVNINAVTLINEDAYINKDLYTRDNIFLLSKDGNTWLDFATRDVSGSEAKFSLSNISDIYGTGPITLSDAYSYLQLYNNSGQGRAMLRTNNSMFFTVESRTLPDADAITIDRDAGFLGDGIPYVNINAVTSINEDAYISNVKVGGTITSTGVVRYIPKVVTASSETSPYVSLPVDVAVLHLVILGNNTYILPNGVVGQILKIKVSGSNATATIRDATDSRTIVILSYNDSYVDLLYLDGSGWILHD